MNLASHVVLRATALRAVVALGAVAATACGSAGPEPDTMPAVAASSAPVVAQATAAPTSSAGRPMNLAALARIRPAKQLPPMLAVPLPTFEGAIPCSGDLDRAKVTSLLGGPLAGGGHVVVTIAKGDTCAFPQTKGIDAILVVAAGELGLAADARNDVLEPWDAFHAPGLGVRGTARKATTVVLALASHTGKDVRSAFDKATEWKERFSALEMLAITEAKELSWGGGAFGARIAFGAPGSRFLSLEVMRLAASATIPAHDHAETEVVTVVAGSGTMTIGSKTEKVEPGKTFVVPARVKHAFTAGADPVLIVQSYAPSGPEQRFVKLSDEAAVNGGAAPGASAAPSVGPAVGPAAAPTP